MTNRAFHYAGDADRALAQAAIGDASDQFNYTFQNFFHPFVPQLVNELNTTSIAGMLDPDFLAKLRWKFEYQPVQN
jgi:hypothetical protein